MLLLKYLLRSGGVGMMVVAAAMLTYDICLEMQYRPAMAVATTTPLPPVPCARWRSALALGLFAWGPILCASGIVVVPSGMAGVRVSQTRGTLPGTPYPGVHFVTPVAESIRPV